jgi:hypothetical protein
VAQAERVSPLAVAVLVVSAQTSLVQLLVVVVRQKQV